MMKFNRMNFEQLKNELEALGCKYCGPLIHPPYCIDPINGHWFRKPNGETMHVSEPPNGATYSEKLVKIYIQTALQTRVTEFQRAVNSDISA